MSEQENSSLRAELTTTARRLERIEKAAREVLEYLDEVGPTHLDAGMEESGCDAETGRLRAVLDAGE